MQVGVERGHTALCDLGALLHVLADPVEMLHIVGPPQELHKVFVVGDDEELEVALFGAALDDPD